MSRAAARATAGSAVRRRADLPASLLVFIGYTFLFWIFRERSYSGDAANWIWFLEHDFWYRLREPTSLAIYQLPFQLLKPYGASAADVFAAVSCVCGGFSMAYALEIFRSSWAETEAVVLGMLALTLSFGVTGVFFGHVEHYCIMSLGCFAYLYYALQYLNGERTIFGPSLAFALLFTTHLMAAWLLPSLFLLPWLRDNASRGRELARSFAVVVALNGLLWLIVVFLYYGGAPENLMNDVFTGRYTQGGNALGGGNNTTFLTPGQIFSLGHALGMAALFLMYSPFLVPALGVCLAHRPRERFGWLLHSPVGRFLFSLWLPYTLFALSWQADLGYAQDWDLFSHWTLFALLPVLGMLFSLKRPGLARAVVGAGLLASALGTGYLVRESARLETPPGPLHYFAALDLRGSGHGSALEDRGPPNRRRMRNTNMNESPRRRQ